MKHFDSQLFLPLKEFAYSYEVSRGTGRRFAISDIHGCYNSLVSILQKIGFSSTDQLFVLGDSINRGKSPMKVIQLLFDMQRKGFQVHVLRGNHEHNLLSMVDTVAPFVYRRKLREMGLHELLSIREEIEPHFLLFFRTLPYYIQLDTCFLVHAGFYFENGNPLTNYSEMLTIRNMSALPASLDGKRIIHGHTPVDLSVIRSKIEQKSMVINIDNGCALAGREADKGNLVCLNIDTLELFVQKNID